MLRQAPSSRPKTHINYRPRPVHAQLVTAFFEVIKAGNCKAQANQGGQWSTQGILQSQTIIVRCDDRFRLGARRKQAKPDTETACFIHGIFRLLLLRRGFSFFHVAMNCITNRRTKITGSSRGVEFDNTDAKGHHIVWIGRLEKAIGGPVVVVHAHEASVSQRVSDTALIPWSRNGHSRSRSRQGCVPSKQVSTVTPSKTDALQKAGRSPMVVVVGKLKESNLAPFRPKAFTTHGHSTTIGGKSDLMSLICGPTRELLTDLSSRFHIEHLDGAAPSVSIGSHGQARTIGRQVKEIANLAIGSSEIHFDGIPLCLIVFIDMK